MGVTSAVLHHLQQNYGWWVV